MVSYIEESYASDYSESIPINLTHTTRARFPRSNRCAAAILIIVTVLERCGYYTLTVNLPFTISRWFKLKSAESLSSCEGDSTNSKYGHLDTFVVVVLMVGFYLLCSLFSIIGGWLGDSKLGKYRTLLLSFVAYIVGTSTFLGLVYAMICNTLREEKEKSTHLCDNFDLSQNTINTVQWVLLVISFFFISLGYGLCKPNIAPFGAQQMVAEGEGMLQKFYLWFYFCTNVGSLIAFGFAFFQSQTAKPNQYLGSFIAPVVCSVLCLVLLIIGSKSFIKTEPSEDSFKTFFMILAEWLKLTLKERPQVIADTGMSRVELLKRHNGGNFGEEEVDSFKDLWRVMPILSTMLIYWAAYSQFFSFFYFQGFYLIRPSYLPLSIVNLFNPILILFLVPFLNHVLYPYLERKNCSLHAITRMQIGFGLAALSLVAAIIIAIMEKEFTQPQWNPVPISYFHPSDNNSEYVTYAVRDKSIFLLSPQIILMSLSEVFAIIASMEFVYVEAPQYMKSFAMGIYFGVSALGDLLAIVLVLLVKGITSAGTHHQWICNNLNNGHLDRFFLLLYGLLLLNMLVLWRNSRYFTPNYLSLASRRNGRNA